MYNNLRIDPERKVRGMIHGHADFAVEWDLDFPGNISSVTGQVIMKYLDIPVFVYLLAKSLDNLDFLPDGAVAEIKKARSVSFAECEVGEIPDKAERHLDHSKSAWAGKWVDKGSGKEVAIDPERLESIRKGMRMGPVIELFEKLHLNASDFTYFGIVTPSGAEHDSPIHILRAKNGDLLLAQSWNAGVRKGANIARLSKKEVEQIVLDVSRSYGTVVTAALKPLIEKRFYLLIFDLDGTLIDSRVSIRSAFNHTLRSYGYETAEDSAIDRMIGTPIAEMYKQFLHGVDEKRLEELVRAYRAYYAEISDKGVVLLEGVPEILEELKSQGYTLAVATTKNIALTAPLLKKLGLSDYFEIVVGSSDQIRNKPHPDMLLHIMQKLGISPQKAVLIGDTAVDGATANNAGIVFIGVRSGEKLGLISLEELKKSGPIAVIDTLRELPQQVSSVQRSKTKV